MKLHSCSDQHAIAQEASPYPVIARSAARAEAVRRDMAIQSVACDSREAGAGETAAILDGAAGRSPAADRQPVASGPALGHAPARRCEDAV